MPLTVINNLGSIEEFFTKKGFYFHRNQYNSDVSYMHNSHLAYFLWPVLQELAVFTYSNYNGWEIEVKNSTFKDKIVAIAKEYNNVHPEVDIKVIL